MLLFNGGKINPLNSAVKQADFIPQYFPLRPGNVGCDQSSVFVQADLDNYCSNLQRSCFNSPYTFIFLCGESS